MPIIVDHLVHEYDTGSKDKVRALDDINLVIEDGEFVGLIGHTGSGKSTLVQHLDALLKPSSGTVYFNGEDIFEKGYELKTLRRKLGLVFQYPEHQLFEATVFDDVCFGPKNLGLDSKEVELRAFAALKQVGIEDSVFYTSPFDLSGGQKRRVAITGVLAMKPEVLVLDEPTAGLDPEGRTEILSMVKKLHDEGLTIILVSHSMEDVADYVDRIIAMDKGKILLDGDVRSVFAQVDVLEEVGLGAPAVNYV
ncbi:MAG: energy-coupling factor transporter ATPase, partial [Lachnospiraceae bacterium]|nr:energy-coupling factor transporter ATPase [Lachnospiraceae bacterium]